MRITSREIIDKFLKKHAKAKSPLTTWLITAEKAEWTRFQDIRNDFNSADQLSGNRVVFNIGGHNYRMVVLVQYKSGVLLILKIGTHAEYDRWKLD